MFVNYASMLYIVTKDIKKVKSQRSKVKSQRSNKSIDHPKTLELWNLELGTWNSATL